MSQSASDTIRIDASAETVWTVITDLEAYPEWTEEMTHVEVLSTDEQGRPHRAAFTVDARVVEVHYTLEYEYGDDEVSWRLVESEILEELNGSYAVSGVDGGVRVTYELEGDVDIPVPAFMKKRAVRRILEQGLAGLKARAESRE